MAHIVNPHNIDVDDDAVFMGALSQGLIWIEDDIEGDADIEDIYAEYTIEDVLYEAKYFIEQRADTWVNFTPVAQYLHRSFNNFNPKHIADAGKSYTSLIKLIEDHPSHFELRKDENKQGLYWIRVVPYHPPTTTAAIFMEMHSYLQTHQQEWVNFSRLSHHIYQKFPDINLKQLGLQGKTYKNLRKVVEDYPNHFTVRADEQKQGLYWIRITEKDY